jgi:hypothetical protein
VWLLAAGALFHDLIGLIMGLVSFDLAMHGALILFLAADRDLQLPRWLPEQARRGLRLLRLDAARPYLAAGAARYRALVAPSAPLYPDKPDRFCHVTVIDPRDPRHGRRAGCTARRGWHPRTRGDDMSCVPVARR